MSGNYPNLGETSLDKLIQSVQDLFSGRNNCFGECTLAVAPATTTVVRAPNMGPQSIPLLIPLNAAAATEWGAGGLYISAREAGQFTITHSSSAGTRNYGFVTLG